MNTAGLCMLQADRRLDSSFNKIKFCLFHGRNFRPSSFAIPWAI
jgi:hypothetical protein